MNKFIKTTYSQMTTESLLQELKFLSDFMFGKNAPAYHLYNIDSLDKVECELNKRGFSWEELEKLEIA